MVAVLIHKVTMNPNRPLWVELTSGMASVHRKVNTYGESSAIDLVGKDTQSEGLVDSLVEAGEQLEQTFSAGNVSYYSGAKRFEAISVVAEDAVFRAHPHETQSILINLPHCEVVEAFRCAEGANTVFLGVQSSNR